MQRPCVTSFTPRPIPRPRSWRASRRTRQAQTSTCPRAICHPPLHLVKDVERACACALRTELFCTYFRLGFRLHLHIGSFCLCFSCFCSYGLRGRSNGEAQSPSVVPPRVTAVPVVAYVRPHARIHTYISVVAVGQDATPLLNNLLLHYLPYCTAQPCNWSIPLLPPKSHRHIFLQLHLCLLHHDVHPHLCLHLRLCLHLVPVVDVDASVVGGT